MVVATVGCSQRREAAYAEKLGLGCRRIENLHRDALSRTGIH